MRCWTQSNPLERSVEYEAIDLVGVSGGGSPCDFRNRTWAVSGGFWFGWRCWFYRFFDLCEQLWENGWEYNAKHAGGYGLGHKGGYRSDLRARQHRQRWQSRYANRFIDCPPGLAGLKIDGTTVPTGWRIKVAYLDFFGDRISTTLAVPKWRNPDKITVIIIGKTTNREFYRFDNVIYRSVSYPFDPLEILIPKTEISDIYDDRHFYIVRVVVEFDGVKYSGESL